MQTRNIGSLAVSVVGLGCNNFGWGLDEAASARVIDAAIDAGVNFFDTADMYGATQSESFIGRALGTRRDKVILATKFGWELSPEKKGAHPDYIRAAVEDSLRRLATDRIDLYQLHKPDPEVPIADTLGALEALVKDGKVREIGCSNFSVAQMREAQSAAKSVRFVSLQNEYSMVKRDVEADVLPECQRTGLAFLPYFPLASGLLSGKYRRGQPIPGDGRLARGERFAALLSEQSLDRVERLIGFASDHGRSLLDLAFSWLLAHQPVASVIAGATRPAQIQANAAAADWVLSAQDMQAIDALLAD